MKEEIMYKFEIDGERERKIKEAYREVMNEIMTNETTKKEFFKYLQVHNEDGSLKKRACRK
jgi:hypothetical protein